MKKISEEWLNYRTKCYPQGVSALQEIETRQAFMAGALIAFKMIEECGQIEPEKKAAEALEVVYQDIFGEVAARVKQCRARN